MKHILKVSLVVWSDGSLNDEGSVKAFVEAYESYKAEAFGLDDAISTAVHKVFDLNHGEAIPMPALIHGALNHLPNVAANYTVMHEKVQNFIRDNSDRAEKKDRKTGEILQYAEPARTRQFGVRKGRGGGCSRWADVPFGKE